MNLFPVLWDALMPIKRRNLHDHLKYCQKIYATQGQGDSGRNNRPLQGRIPKSVFARYYLRPDMDAEFGKVRKALETLRREI